MIKELNAAQTAAVYGAGPIADVAGDLGGAIGGVVDAGTSLLGIHTDAKTPATSLGKGIGEIIELSPLKAVADMGAGIVGIVGVSIDGLAQLLHLKKS